MRRTDPEKRRGRRATAQRGAALAAPALLAVLGWVIARSTGDDVPPEPRGAAGAAPPPLAHPSAQPGVEQLCATCHPAPPPEALPRARWAQTIREMATFAAPGRANPLGPDEVARAIESYERRAPEALEPVAHAAAPDRPRFDLAEYTPLEFGPERIPATSQLAFVPAPDGKQLDLLVAEMRSRSVSRLPALGSPRELRVVGAELAYPVNVAPGDLDGDGASDLLIAALGGMNPSNDVNGAAIALFAAPHGGYRAAPLAAPLARPADARAADFDGDGDLDVAVAAFGWRGPGELLVLENLGGWRPERLARRTIDDRDGFVALGVDDLDGDGRRDLVALLAQEHEQVIAFLSRDRLAFEPRVLHRAPHAAWGYSGMELVDLDRDGDRDLLLANGDALDDELLKPYHGVSWLERRGPLDFVEHAIGRLAGVQRAAAGDLDADGDLDVAAAAFLPHLSPAAWKAHDLDSVVWFERSGAAWVRHAIEKHRPIHPAVALGDWNADGRLDVAVGNYVWLRPDGSPASITAEAVSVLTQRPPR